MKKVIATVAIGLFGFGGIQANAQAVEQGNVIIDVYYGFPNLAKSLVKNAYANSGTEENVQIGGIGPIGGRFEYMVADRIGVGLESNYTSTIISYDYDSFDNNNDPVVYTDEVSYTVLRIMPRINFHFGNSDVFDAYGAVAAGFRSAKYAFESTDPNYDDESIEGALPVAFRLAVGGRYFFTDNIGINMEFGLGGGALLGGGISLKF